MRVLIVGPSRDIKGGVSQVIRLMMENAPAEVEYLHIPTVVPQVQVPGPWRLSYRQAKLVLRNIHYFVRSLKQIKKLLKAQEVDLLHIHFSSWGSCIRKYFVTSLAQRMQYPYILHAHGGSFAEFYASLASPLKSRVRQMLSKAEGIVILSQQWQTFYRSILHDERLPMWIMPNPVVVPTTVYFGSENQSVVLLYLGRMNEWKGSDRVLRAVANLPESVKQKVRIRMAGDNEIEPTIQLVKQFNLQSQVEIQKWVEGEQKLDWLSTSDVFILPSRAEGLPMAMLEAMAYGKALIVSPVGGIPEFVSDGQEGFLVPPDDIQAISRAIAILAENPELRVQMGRAARQRVEELDISRYMQKMYAIYQQCLSAYTEAFE